MKTCICVLFLVAVVAAEPPRYRLARLRSEKQEWESEKELTTPRAEEAPYPAAGFRPPKEFKLPSREEPPAASYGIPADSYAAPFHTFIAPQVEYGVPEFRMKESLERKKGGGEKEKKEGKEGGERGKKEGEKRGEEKEGEKREGEKREHKKERQEEPKNDAETVSAQGAYYVLLPDLQLQRVQFQTENDYRNMAYTARLQYKNEDRAPIYVYTAVPQYGSSAYVTLI